MNVPTEQNGRLRSITGSLLLRQPFLRQWTKLHAELSRLHPMAGLFRGWKPSGLDLSDVRILYVGKATSGECRDDNREEIYFNKKGLFWSFAREIATAVDMNPETLDGFAWSNISKVARPQIAADPRLIYGFEELVVLTLEDEIVQTRPHLVIFVTGHFSDSVVAGISQTSKDEDWIKSEDQSNCSDHSDIWWRDRADGTTVLCMRHPMGAKSSHRAHAAQIVKILVAKKIGL